MELENTFLQEDLVMVAEYFQKQPETLSGSQQQHLVQEVTLKYHNLGIMETVLIIRHLENDYKNILSFLFSPILDCTFSQFF